MTHGTGESPPSVERVLLFTDIVESTALKQRLGDREAVGLITQHHRLFRELLEMHSGTEIENLGDGFFATFELPSDAVTFALEFQMALKHDEQLEAVRVRIGIHRGEILTASEDSAPSASKNDLYGLAIDTAARIMSLAQGRQVLTSKTVFDAAREKVQAAEGAPSIRWLAHGPYLFKGIDEPLDVFEVGERHLAPMVRPKDSEKARRAIVVGDEVTLGWRPARGLRLPDRPEWKLESKLGEGGFGEVWTARDLKSDEVHAFKFCFKAERVRNLKRERTLFRLMQEALGDRDDIARLHRVQLDSAPYYLEFEYTAGADLAKWSESQGGIGALSLEKRLEIVAQVAEAVSAAHSVGVIHKDIKPTNILIETTDEEAIQPKLTDFGIGQLMNKKELERAGILATGFTTGDSAQLTELSSRTGTRLYMAPELLAGKPPTVQSDVYALGVLLYQVVVADLSKPLGHGWELEIKDELLKEDIAACIAGDPERRVKSASLLAEMLWGRSVRLAERKRERRLKTYRRASRYAGAGLVIALIVFAGLAFEANRRANREASLRRETEIAKENAEEERERAEIEAKTAKQTLRFVSDLFTSATPWVDGGAGRYGIEVISNSVDHNLTARQILDRGAERIESSLKDEPLVKANILKSLGRTYSNLGAFEKADEFLLKSLKLYSEAEGDHSNEVGFTKLILGVNLESQRRYSEAAERLEEASAIFESLGERGEFDLIQTRRNLSEVLQRDNRMAEAEKVARETLALALDRKSPDGKLVDRGLAASLMQRLASILASGTKSGEAMQLYKMADSVFIDESGEDSLVRAVSRAKIGRLYFLDKEFEQAEHHLRESLRILEIFLPQDNQDLIRCKGNLILTLIAQANGAYFEGRTADALPLFEEAVMLQKEAVGEEHVDIARSLNMLGQVYRMNGDYESGLEAFRESVKIADQTLGKDNLETQKFRKDLEKLQVKIAQTKD